MPLNVDSINTGSLSVNGNPIGNYKVYTAILSQNSTGAPSANILENTIQILETKILKFNFLFVVFHP